MPALVARLVAAGDRPSNREAAAGALAEIGAPAASEAIPALVQVLEKEAPESLRRGVVRSLGAQQQQTNLVNVLKATVRHSGKDPAPY